MPEFNTTPLYQEISTWLTASPEYAMRVFHGRGQSFPGLEHLNIEWYPPYLFVQNFRETLENEVRLALEYLFNEFKFIDAVLIQTRTWPELTTDIFLERGQNELPIIFWTSLNDKLNCQITLGKNRNTGAFLDMRAGWEWVNQNSRGKKVLNLFSYTSIFSLFAIEGGATSVVNMDMAAGVLKTAQRNHQHNDLNKGKASFYKRDILKSAQQFSKMGPYDLMIIDPPPYQKKSFTGWKDYQKLLLRCEKSLNTNGQIFTCLNNPQVTLAEFEESLRATFPKAKTYAAVDISPEIKEANESKGLKLIAIQF